jgi:hypothetical protein
MALPSVTWAWVVKLINQLSLNTSNRTGCREQAHWPSFNSDSDTSDIETNHENLLKDDEYSRQNMSTQF